MHGSFLRRYTSTPPNTIVDRQGIPSDQIFKFVSARYAIMDPSLKPVTQGGCSGGCCGSVDRDAAGEPQIPSSISLATQDTIISTSGLEHEMHGPTRISHPDGEEMSTEKEDSEKCQEGCCRPKSDMADVVAAGSKEGDSCCSPPQTRHTTMPRRVKEVDEMDGCAQEKSPPSCREACCSSKGVVSEPKGEEVIADCCNPTPEAAMESSCKDSSRYTSNAVPTSSEQSTDESCGNRNTKSGQAGCKQAVTGGEDCCGPKLSSTQEGDAPSCCQGKTKPCCDSSCIDRLALRECESVCHQTSESTRSAKSGTVDRGSACSSHAASVRKRYSSKLEALGCICRALVALGQESCCVSRERSTTDGGRRKSSSARTPPRIAETLSKGAKNRSKVSKTVSNAGCQDACCRTTGTRQDADLTGTTGESGSKPSPPYATLVDLEQGLSGTEYVVLSIRGMTCTGCETKLQRVLGSVPAVSNLKTSLVMARTEFNLDIAAMSVPGVMKHLERTTEFKCEQISVKGDSIDVVPEGDVKAFLEQPLPLGVNSMQPLGRSSVRINFDPKAMGARDLLEKHFKMPSKLDCPSADPGLAAGSKHVRNVGYKTLLSCVLTVPVLVLAWAPLPGHELAYAATSLALASIIQVVIAGPFFPTAVKSLVFSHIIEMDLLIVLSTSAAYVFSVVSFGYLVKGAPLSTGSFFETSTLLVSLIMVGRWVGALARQKAVESISVRSLQASTALLCMEEGQTAREIDTRLFQYRDEFIVLPETRVPTDGIVIDGASEVDESMLTGETRPVEKQMNDKVIAGSINGSGKLVVQLTRLPSENTISSIAGLVDQAKLSKPRIQDLADRVASYFVPCVVGLTIITFVVWVAVGVAVRRQSGSETVIQAITFAITVLIVSCPCAVGLAVPMVIVVGSGVAAVRGIIFKSAESIETAYRATHVVFDKTGTLTEGKLKVIDEYYYGELDADVRSKILGLVSNSKHPVSAAVASYLADKGVTPVAVDGIRSVPGKGIQGSLGGTSILGGNARWLDTGSDTQVQAMLADGRTIFCVAINSQLCAVYGLTDTIRPDAFDTVAGLKKRSVRVSVLSGDDHGAVQAVANELGIDADCVLARCTPGDKQQYIQRLLAAHKGGKQEIVLFVGDGTNDAVALAQATIGVHVNSSGGTDIAQSAADVILMQPSLRGIVTMMDISRASVLRIAFNFAWSFVYNVMAVLLGSGALVAAGNGRAVRIPPEYAGLGELVSVLPVVAIAVGLKWARF